MASTLMTESHIPTSVLSRLLAADTEDEILDLIVNSAQQLGFLASRYYDTNHCPVRKENYYTLRVANPPCANLPIGDSIKDASLDSATRSLLGIEYVVDSDTCLCESIEATRPWCTAIPLRGQTWIDVEIRLSQRRVGLWALSRSAHSPILDNDVHSIISVARLASMRLTELVDRARWKFLRDFRHENTASLIGGLQYIGNLTAAASVAYFDLNITTGRLIKSVELVRRENGDWSPIDNQKCREDYLLGQHLTGSAWFDKNLHYIPFFSHLIDERPELVSKNSLDFHKEVLGRKVTTALYELVDYPGAPRGLIRLINRSDLPSLPFNSLHSQTLALATQHLSQFLATLEITQRIEASWTHYFEALAEIEGTNVPYLAIAKSLTKLGIPSASQTIVSSEFQIIEHWQIKQTKAETKRLDEYKGKHLKLEGLRFSTQRANIYRIDNIPSGIGDLARRLGSQFVYLKVDNAHANRVLTMFGIISSERGDGRVQKELERIWQDSPHQRRLLDGFSYCLTSIFDLVSARSQASLNNLAVGRISHDLLRPTNRMQNIARIIAELFKNCIPSITESTIHKLAYVDVDRTSNEYVSRSFISQTELQTQVNRWMFELQSNFDEAYSIIQTAFSWARLESGKSGLNLSMVDLNELLERSIDQLQTLLLTKPFTRIQIDPSVKALGRFHADRDLLRTLCVNLLDNAIKYSHRGGKGKSIIRVAAERSGEFVVLRFSNWGLGILERDYEKVFESYVRRSLNDPIESYSGAGLGLSTCKKIVEAHGGEIGVESIPMSSDLYRTQNQKGYLTTFTVRLPLNLNSSGE